MGLAEALLRIPDDVTALALARLRLSAPLVLKLARQGMRYLGEQFILGSTLEDALRRAKRRRVGPLLSVDLLGESARTLIDAESYRDSLLATIETLEHEPPPERGTVEFKGPAPLARTALSLKLSVLEPRYEEAQRAIVLRRLVPTLVTILEAAAKANLAVTIDAEEQERLELSLDVMESALGAPALARWAGAGLAVQAYGTRALRVVVTSAFRAAGQRCSALRLLCLQEEIAGPVLAMLIGAMDALIIGDPADPATDVGPLIDRAALEHIEEYIASLPIGATILHRVSLGAAAAHGHFCSPTVIELSSVGVLTREIFGPVPHIVHHRATDLLRGPKF